MTFDTCQWEERDIIFYSMVATEEEDHLWWVFIKDLNDIDIEEDGKIKAQRLNVGFSRAKECIHFVLSKPIEKFKGEIQKALSHYKFELEQAKKEANPDEVDKNSPMEKEVLHWFYQTDFWKNKSDRVEFKPQFELWKYLKQLDNRYDHPKYKVDFLLIYKDEFNKENKIVIEYDGFKEHFTEIEDINEYNYQSYYNEDDIYREKILESYWYKFIRINRFNVGKDPIKTLNWRIEETIKDWANENKIIRQIHKNINDLESGNMKRCPKCNEVKDLSEFKDKSLINGYGRFCMECKEKKNNENTTEKKEVILIDNKLCPRCSSKMVLRDWRYWKFYGCSKFPYCRGTRQY